MPTNGVGSVLKITARRVFKRENYELRNYELWRRLHKSLMIRRVRHARSRLGAAAGQRRKAVEEGRRAERPADRLGRPQRGDRARRRLDGEQVGETPGAARHGHIEVVGAMRSNAGEIAHLS